MPTAANSFHLSKKSDEEKSLTILFQGDSISDGDRSRNNDWIWDGVHPIPARHELIARRWIKEVSKS
jgi:lysophospholipase L1-like esterase